MWAIILTTVWWVTGYYLVIYLAGLQDIPPELYEAAAIDGASGWRRFWSITLPLLRPVLLFVLVTHVIGSFQIFGQVYILTDGGPGDATRTVVQHLYETAFRNFFHFGSATAMAWVLFVDHPRILAAPVPAAPRPHGVLMAIDPRSGGRRAARRLLSGHTRASPGRAPRPAAARSWRVVMVAVAVLWLLPAIWVLVTSLKQTENIIRMPPEWIPWPATLAHYVEVLFSSSRTARIGRAFLNSVVVSLGSVVVVVITSAMAAYPLARMQFRGRNVIFVAARRQPDGPERRGPGAPVRAHPAPRLALDLPGSDRPRGGDDLRASACSCSGSSS